MASDRRGLVVDDLVLRLLRASAGVVMVALLVSGGTGVAVGGSSPDPRESVHSPPVVDLAENVATDTRTQRADDCRAPLQQPSAVEGDVVCAYDYRPDFARPPPDDAAAYAYDTAANSAEPAGSLGRVRRVLSGLVLDRVAPSRAAVGLADDALPAALRGGSADVHVYMGVRNGKPVYTWITNNLGRRQAQHGDRFVLQQVTSDPLTRGQARAVEQALIARNPGFENAINSISPRHSYYQQAVDWGEAWLRANGYG